MIYEAEVVEYARQFISVELIPAGKRREFEAEVARHLVWQKVKLQASATDPVDEAFWVTVRELSLAANGEFEEAQERAVAVAEDVVRDLLKQYQP